MPLKQSTIYFQELSENEAIRLWFPFVLPEIRYTYDKLNNSLSLCESGSRPKGGINGEDDKDAISLGGEQIGSDGDVNLSKIPYISNEFYDNARNGKVQNGDILICKDGALTGKTCFVDFGMFPLKKIMVNEHIYILRGSEKINQKFLFYLSRNDLFQSQIKDLAYKKKAQPGLNYDHIKKIKIPKILKTEQDKIVAQIEPIEKKIEELKNKITPAQEVINRVFAKEFGFDENLYNEFGKGMTAGTQIAQDKMLRTFEIDFSELDVSSILRFSTRFHNTPTKKLMDFLDNIKTVQVKDIVDSYEKGLQPKYDMDGDVSVVKIANLKNSYIDFSETENISQTYFDKLEDKKKLRLHDIIICATGKVSLGKIDFYDYPNEAITSVDNFIIRLNKKYNPLFFTYFFRSILGYFQIERDYTGATNQIHLYWDQILNFLIPNISLKTQQKVVDEIKTELDKQEEMKKKIEEERNKIDEIIEKAIR
jgi:type I restriction enzyme S subunit